MNMFLKGHNSKTKVVCTSVALTGLSVSVAGKVKILFEWDWCFLLTIRLKTSECKHVLTS